MGSASLLFLLLATEAKQGFPIAQPEPRPAPAFVGGRFVALQAGFAELDMRDHVPGQGRGNLSIFGVRVAGKAGIAFPNHVLALAELTGAMYRGGQPSITMFSPEAATYLGLRALGADSGVDICVGLGLRDVWPRAATAEGSTACASTSASPSGCTRESGGATRSAAS